MCLYKNILPDKIINLYKIKFVSDTSWTFCSTFIVGFSGLILLTLIGNKFFAKGLGIYSQVIAIYSLFTLLSGLGVEVSTLRHSAVYAEDNEILILSFSTSQIMLFASSFICSSVLYCCSIYYPFVFSSPEVAKGIKYVCPGIIFFILNKNSNLFFTGLRKMKSYSIFRSLRWIMILLFSLIFIYVIPLNINYLLLAYSISEVFLFIILLFYNKKFYCMCFSLKWFKIHLTYGIKSVFARLISDFNGKLGVLLVGYLINNFAAGLFSFISSFGQALLTVSSSIQHNFNPVFASNWAKGKLDQIKGNIQKIFRFVLLAVVPIYFFSIIIYTIYVKFFLSVDFQNTTPLFALMCIGIAVYFIFSWSTTMLSMAGLLNENLYRISIGCGINFIIFYGCIKLFSLMGAVIAMAITYIFQIIVSNYFLYRFLNINVIFLAFSAFRKNQLNHNPKKAQV